ncbi:H/ACA RNA-protein complex protein Gar1 [Candidatus Bathyarchaeota archaeon]|nr:H/ACA RNA-protein complex protein Gar1 [Candidatus Bathyarchaeota archaeon]
MRRLGKIIHLSRSGNLILRLEANNYPALGERVVDSRLKEIGRIQDVFGPSAKPYISISPTMNDPRSLIGKIAYSDQR